MVRTIADALKEEGAIEESRKLLLRLLHSQFGEVPAAMLATIETTTDREQLAGWCERLLKAKTLKDVKIGRRR